MNTFEFYLTGMGFVSMILIILSIVITIYMLQSTTKSRSSWLLIGFFISVIANSITMLFANAWVYWGDMLMPAQDAWILLGGVALAQFAYQIPQYDQKREARWMLAITATVALFAVGYSLDYMIRYIFFYTPGLNENQAYYLLLPIMTVFTVAIFLRRAVYYESLSDPSKKDKRLKLHGLLKALTRPQDRSAKMMRDFALAISLGLLPGIASVLKPLSFIPSWLPSYMLSTGSILAVAALALVYINSSHEQTSFIAKIMGISLVAFLLIFGAYGISSIQGLQYRNHRSVIDQIRIAYQGIQTDDFSYLPDSIAYIIAWPRDQVVPGATEEPQATVSDQYRLLYLAHGEQDFQIEDLIAENQLLIAGAYPEINVLYPISEPTLDHLSESPMHLLTRYGTYPYGSMERYRGYLFDQNDTRYEIGLSEYDRLNVTHEMVVSLTAWVIVSSLIIIIFFPMFYRYNLVRPLNNLLKAIMDANRGDLDTRISVQYEDEIGFLTRSFNNLLATLKEANQTRELLDAELQERMEELRISEEKFSKAFHSSPVCMMLQSQDDRTYQDVNAAFTRVLGYEPEEAIGRTPLELRIYPTIEESQRVIQAFSDFGDRLRNFEFQFRRKSGQVGTGLLSAEFFEWQGRKTNLGIVMDITERKQAENEIRRLNAEMEARVAERSQELSTFLDLAFLVSSQESIDQIFLPALERILDISGFKAVSVHIYSPDNQYLTLDAQVGINEVELDRMCVLTPHGSFAAWLSQPRDALLLSNLETDTILPDLMHLPNQRSCLATQLVAQDQVLGLMTCYRQDVHTFSLEEVSLLVAVAEQLAVSLENQRLRKKAEQAAVFTERRRLARDLHDSITQSIFGLTLFTRSSQDALSEGDLSKLTDNLRQIEMNAVTALREMRLLLYQMQPLEPEVGFSDRINARLDLVERRLGIQALLQIDQTVQLSPEFEETLFLIALEALNNSLKHAQAKHVEIILEQNNGILWMRVADDGHGFEIGDQSDRARVSGMGLKNMHSRTAELNGDLKIESAPGRGTTVTVTVDLSSTRDE